MATATLPALFFLLVLAPLKAWYGEPVSLDGAIVGLAMLAVSGAAAGVAFRALYGARPIEPR